MSTVLREYIVNQEHHKFRRDFEEYANLSKDYKELGLIPKERMNENGKKCSGLLYRGRRGRNKKEAFHVLRRQQYRV